MSRNRATTAMARENPTHGDKFAADDAANAAFMADCRTKNAALAKAIATSPETFMGGDGVVDSGMYGMSASIRGGFTAGLATTIANNPGAVHVGPMGGGPHGGGHGPAGPG